MHYLESIVRLFQGLHPFERTRCAKTISTLSLRSQNDTFNSPME